MPDTVSWMMLADFDLARADPPDNDNVRYERKLPDRGTDDVEEDHSYP